jgi:putative endonuclease
MTGKQYYVYMITNKINSVLYIGVTNNLIRRVYEHKNKLAEGFSSKYNLNKLVYYEVCSDPNNAIKREKTLKNLVRRRKDLLITGLNPNWADLYFKLI